MAEMYVVYVAAPEMEPSPADRQRLAELLRLDSAKLDALLDRLPAEVTKPVPESTAVTVARRFREAGLEASIRPYKVNPAQAAPAQAVPVQPEPESANSVHSGPTPDQSYLGEGRSDQDEIWKTQFGGGGSAAAESVRPEEPTRGTEPAPEVASNRTDEPQAGGPRIGDRSRAGDPLDADEEDELFPPSSFGHTQQGPKAPSKPLVVALVVVLVVLAGLWILL